MHGNSQATEHRPVYHLKAHRPGVSSGTLGRESPLRISIPSSFLVRPAFPKGQNKGFLTDESLSDCSGGGSDHDGETCSPGCPTRAQPRPT